MKSIISKLTLTAAALATLAAFSTTTVAAEKVGVKRGTRFGRFAAAEGLRQRQQVFAGKTDNADAAAMESRDYRAEFAVPDADKV